MILWNLGEKLCRVKIICHCFCQNRNELQRRSTSNNNATQSDSKWKFGCLIKRALSVLMTNQMFGTCMRRRAHEAGPRFVPRAALQHQHAKYHKNLNHIFPFKLGQYKTQIRFTILKCKDILLITHFFSVA